jgi:dihydroflavonol-4-reductase
LALQATRGLQLVLVRPPMLLGPGDHRGRATSQIRRFMRKPLPFILAGGIHYIDIRDAAQAVRRLLELEKPRPIYHLRGTACTLSDFFADLEVVCQRSAPRRRLPWGLAWSLAQADVHLGVGVRGRPFGLLPDPVVIEMARHYWDVSSTFAEADLNYCSRPKLETLQDTVNDLRQSAV